MIDFLECLIEVASSFATIITLMHHDQNTIARNSFEKILEKDQNILMVNRQDGIIKVVWGENVNLTSTKIILNKAAILVGEGDYDKIILDRKKLHHFEIEARIWIKNNFLDNKAKKLVQNIVRVAAIDPTDVKGRVFANFVNAGIRLIFPTISLSHFQEEEAAISWLATG